MKKILYLFVACLTLAGCKKDSFVSNFDQKPEERMAESIALVNNTLTAAPNGWVATLSTSAGGGFGFYMTFDQDQNVTMYADLNDNTATKLGTSTYRVKSVLGAELIFDTYNYISMLADPNNSVFGGAGNTGHRSDVEFILDRVNGDSIIFTGKNYRQKLTMIKASVAQQTAYKAEGLKTSSDKLKAFFANIKYPYIEVPAGASMIKVGVSANFSNTLDIGKRATLIGILPDGKTVASGVGKFGVTVDGLNMTGSGLSYQGVNFVKFAWKDATTLAMYDSTGKEYVIKSNSEPFLPFQLLFGFPTTFLYKKITIGSAGLPSGVTSGFTAVYQQMQALFVSGGRSVTSTNFILVSNSVFRVEVNYLSGTSAFVASADYNYTKVGDIITLDNNPVGNVNWPTRAVQIKPLADYMLTGPFKVDWVISTNPNAGTLGGLYRTANASSFIYGNL